MLCNYCVAIGTACKLRKHTKKKTHRNNKLKKNKHGSLQIRIKNNKV